MIFFGKHTINHLLNNPCSRRFVIGVLYIATPITNRCERRKPDLQVICNVYERVGERLFLQNTVQFVHQVPVCAHDISQFVAQSEFLNPGFEEQIEPHGKNNDCRNDYPVGFFFYFIVMKYCIRVLCHCFPDHIHIRLFQYRADVVVAIA